MAKLTMDQQTVTDTARKLIKHSQSASGTFKPSKTVEEYKRQLAICKAELNTRYEDYFSHLVTCEGCRNVEHCPDPIRDPEAYEDWKVAYRSRGR